MPRLKKAISILLVAVLGVLFVGCASDYSKEIEPLQQEIRESEGDYSEEIEFLRKEIRENEEIIQKSEETIGHYSDPEKTQYDDALPSQQIERAEADIREAKEIIKEAEARLREIE